MDKITTYNDFLSFVKIEENINLIELNIKEIIKIITSGNISGTPFNKKYLENFLEFIFKFIIEDIDLNKSRNFIQQFFPIILDLAFMYQEKFNSLIKEFLNEKTNIILQGFSTESLYEDIENSRNLLSQFIKSGILISYLTHNIKQTNQILSNYILLCITILNNLKINIQQSKIFVKSLNVKLIFISIITIITENINSFNPDVLNCLKNILNLFGIREFNKENSDCQQNCFINDLKDCLIFGNNLDLLQIEKNCKIEYNKKSLIFIFLKKLININLDLFKFHKEDINFNILFSDNYNFFKNIEKICEDIFKTKESNFYEGFFKENYLNKIQELCSFYEINKDKCLAKKNVQINFLILKSKEIPSLEPEYDFGPVSFDQRKEKINNAIEKKIKKTKKQAIRNLKKESRILDQERQKVLKKIDAKRKEDLKFSNQFIEQQNQEYKKMMTSNAKKRFKLRKGKITKK